MENKNIYDDMYGIKGVRKIKFNYQKGELELDTINEVDCIQINGNNVVIVDFQVADDKVFSFLNGFKEGDLEVFIDIKRWLDGEYASKTSQFQNLSLIRRFVNYSCAEVTNHRYVFADCEYKEIKSELIAYLLPSCKNDLTEILKVEQKLLLKKIQECREKGEFNTYKNLINALREVTYLVNQEETRILNIIN